MQGSEQLDNSGLLDDDPRLAKFSVPAGTAHDVHVNSTLTLQRI